MSLDQFKPLKKPPSPPIWPRIKPSIKKMVENGIPIAFTIIILACVLQAVTCIGFTTSGRFREDTIRGKIMQGKCSKWCEKRADTMEQQEYIACFDKCKEWQCKVPE